ncbi:hypothetical protein [Cupriavidus sp. D39]|uniref:Cap15 family cyclic dinucleotide receptor domain-containing protein n=1 Tax=Cupriavidus sp. D39 TaxID=2997877 RepID=UPI00226EBF9E|nr:hypothetical protein [Cupriavidus sp. D39]MCY0856660.1 hypothetical protein [Cupriavidus sp. D39]
MMDHEYAVLGGLNRAAIGRYLSMAASAIAAALAAGMTWAIDFARSLGIVQNIPVLILWPLTAGVIYAALYWFFETRGWKWVAPFLKVPDLTGDWTCVGRSMKADCLEVEWNGVVTIAQSWDKIRVRLKTTQSSSSSIAASLIYDCTEGYRLLYNYRNDPKLGEKELVSHRGAAELAFAKDLQSAEGEYFNGHGRYTFGRMTLTRRG